MPERELDTYHAFRPRDACESDCLDEVTDAVYMASGQGQMTWLTSKGKRIAAIVPVEQAEAGMSLQRVVNERGKLPPSPVAPVNVAYLCGLLASLAAISDVHIERDEIEKRLRDA